MLECESDRRAPAGVRRSRCRSRGAGGEEPDGPRDGPVRGGMNICMIGHGMMGTWHSESLAAAGVPLHTLVGRVPHKTEAFARRHGYRRWTIELDAALSDPAIDVVIVAGPSQTHAEMALAALAAGKHVLVEIPLALSLRDAEAVVETAERLGKRLGVVHPLRFRPEFGALCARLRGGGERLRHVQARLFLHRLDNVGSTGLRRSWTDNLLWHHGAHLVDVGLWLAGGGDPQAAEASISRLASVMPPPHEQTGVPMEFAAIIETGPEQSIICTGSYHARERIFDVFAVTDRDSYRLDMLRSTLTTGEAETASCSEQHANALCALDFVAAVREDRTPAVSGRSVLPAMRVLQRIEDEQKRWRAARGQA